MSKKQAFIPAYRRHRARNLAVVTLNGVDHYLGKWNSPESKVEYDRLIAEWIARGRRLPDPEKRSDEMLVKQLIAGYHTHLHSTTVNLDDRYRLALG